MVACRGSNSCGGYWCNDYSSCHVSCNKLKVTRWASITHLVTLPCYTLNYSNAIVHIYKFGDPVVVKRSDGTNLRWQWFREDGVSL
ncbi:hypothetical protein [Coconut foliar decay alphasatellite 3]|uniref:Uncharacterized protein n=1 Tax=Coconut foliar decay alphasatellite 3 TaxID=2161876 RepID=A0A2R4N9B2_9VIRU|nr:hypothetical protein [Coconut foliar decay alphasatellite 3]AVX29425.1 hypothetical protein [Coconut foliar decay alphasatellite 3]